MLTYRKVGGLHFVRVWRFGLTFYLTTTKKGKHHG